jgi:hypothetical protein
MKATAHRQAGNLMRMVNRGLSLILLTLPLLAQQSGPVSTPQPNCLLQFQLPLFGQTVAPFNSPNFDNRFVGCSSFTVTVQVPTTISALSLVVQTAPDNGSGAPGSWSTFTAATGSNPNTLTTGWTATFTTGTSAYFAWLRVQLTSRTGTGQVTGKLFSSIAGGGGSGSGSGGCAGTSATPCVVDGPTAAGSPPTTPPVLTAGQDGAPGNIRTILVAGDGAGVASTSSLTVLDGDLNAQQAIAGSTGGVLVNPRYWVRQFAFNGTGWDRQFVCSNQVFVNLAASGNTQVIAASGSTAVRICHMHLSTTAPETLQITTGTGANCVAGNAVIDAYQSTSAFTFDGGPSAALRGAASQAVCVNASAATTLTGVIIYAQF